MSGDIEKFEEWAARQIAKHNQMLIDRIKGAASIPASPESDDDPQNPNVRQPAEPQTVEKA
jgi:hypothetical protein